MQFIASAPSKAVLFGEHYVVYGSPALSLPIEPRNAVEFSDWEGDGIALKSELGNASILPSGRYDGPDELEIFTAVVDAVFAGKAPPSLVAKFSPAWKLKGVGTSASLCAAFAAGLCRVAKKKATPEEIFAAAQSGDLVAHGGRASGIDAKTVSYGKPLVFQRSFSPPKFEGNLSAFALPAQTELLLIDTNAGKKDGTFKMLEIFASQFGINTTPGEAPEEKRTAVREEYAPLWEKISSAMKKASAIQLGALMDENHALLRRRKMSSAGIEKAVAAAHSEGACGAKLTGGGGEGGAVLALCQQKDSKKIAPRISEATGFDCYHLEVAQKGACAD